MKPVYLFESPSLLNQRPLRDKLVKDAAEGLGRLVVSFHTKGLTEGEIVFAQIAALDSVLALIPQHESIIEVVLLRAAGEMMVKSIGEQSAFLKAERKEEQKQNAKNARTTSDRHPG